MTNPHDPPKAYYRLRWPVLLASFLLVFGLSGAAFAEVWNQNQTLDARVQSNLERGNQIGKAVDSVRVPLCAIMYAALSRPTAGFTPEQLESRGIYIDFYGPGTVDQPGLNCPLPLPKVG